MRNFNPFDHLVLFYIVYIFLNALFFGTENGVRHVYWGVVVQLFPVFSYFLGRSYHKHVSYFISMQKYPLVFAMISGLFFFFTNPAWYVKMKTAGLLSGQDNMFYERMRLSSFFSHPYELAYATILYSLFIISFLFSKNRIKRDEIIQYSILLILSLIVLFLAQLRVTIFIVVLGFIYVFITKSNLVGKIKSIVAIVVFIVTVPMLFNYLQRDTREYIEQHMLSISDSEYLEGRFDHTAGGIVDYNLLGDGLGKYGYTAREEGRFAIVDNEYQNHLAELGYLGTGLIVMIFFLTLLFGFNKKECTLEYLIVLFYIIASFGASVLSNHHQYNYIFWYSVGAIWATGSRKKDLDKVEEPRLIFAKKGKDSTYKHF